MYGIYDTVKREFVIETTGCGIQFYRELFKQHTNEALVSIIKGLRLRMTERKTKSGRIEATAKRAQDMLHGELSIALGIEMKEVEQFITERLDGNPD